MSDPENPPAFPQQCADAQDVGMVHEGMGLRDYYVAKIVPALIAAPQGSTFAGLVNAHAQTKDVGRALALVAGWIADAMLAEREKGGAK